MSKLDILNEQKQAVERTIGYCSDELEKLKQNPIVKKYLESKRILLIASNELKRIETEMVSEKVRSCSHILITDSCKPHYHEYESDGFEYVFCPKCGFTTDFDCLDEGIRNVMISEYAFGNKRNYKVDLTCSKELAEVIKDGILKAYPDIDENTFNNYFTAALYNIITKKDYEKRSKHLSLTNGIKGHIKR